MHDSVITDMDSDLDSLASLSIFGFPDYVVSPDGKVFNLKSGSPLTLNNGAVRLSNRGVHKSFAVSLLVLKLYGNAWTFSDSNDRRDLSFLDPRFNHYGVIRSGSVFNLRFGNKIDGVVTDDGYTKVTISYPGGRNAMFLHRLVAMAFMPNPDNLAEVNHIDGRKSNNAASNLEWCSKYDNMLHARSTGLRKMALTDADIHSACGLLSTGLSPSEVARHLSLPFDAVYKLTRGTHRRIVSGYDIGPIVSRWERMDRT